MGDKLAAAVASGQVTQVARIEIIVFVGSKQRGFDRGIFVPLDHCGCMQATVDESVMRILTPMFTVGLFDIPNNGSIKNKYDESPCLSLQCQD